MLVETIDLDHGYTVEIHTDEDAANPLKEYAGPTLVLDGEAERRFGWSTDEFWQVKLDDALSRIAERGHTPRLYGDGGALTVVARWLRAFYGVRIVLPVSAMEHSGTVVYLGNGAHWLDPGGWDSGWVGWLFATPAQLAEWGFTGTDDELAELLRGSFAEFAAWVRGDVYGYTVLSPDGEVVDSCCGFYGDDWARCAGYMWGQVTAAAEAHWDDEVSAHTALYRGLLAAGGGAR